MLELWQPWVRFWCGIGLTNIMFVMSLYDLHDD